MGLDTSHDCWHGAYSAFMRWREEIARVAGVPLWLMEGFYDSPPQYAMDWAAPRDGGPSCGSPCGPILHHYITDKVEPYAPIAWESLRPSALHVLLSHSDCEGQIEAADCAPLADALEALLPELPEGDGGGHIGIWREKTQKFIDGLRLAASRGENVDFH